MPFSQDSVQRRRSAKPVAPAMHTYTKITPPMNAFIKEHLVSQGRRWKEPGRKELQLCSKGRKGTKAVIYFINIHTRIEGKHVVAS